MNVKFLAILVGIIALAGTTLIVLKPEPQPTDKLSVVTSFYPVYFFAKEIGGDRAEVKNTTPTGVEPHEYEPTPQDIASIERSDVLILNGEGFEPWSEDVLKNIGNNTAVVLAAEGLATQRISEDGEDVVDPHVWLSPKLAKRMVNAVADGYIKADPTNAEHYRENAKALNVKLDALDADYAKGLQSCAKKDIITSHAAFGYIASAYGLRQVAIAGISTEEEPSARQLAEVAEFARKNDVKYIFFETLVSPKLSRTIASEIGAETLVLNPLEGLSNEEIASDKDYFTEMRANLKNLQTALQCTP